MNRALQLVNLFGVLALTMVCVIQWRTNRTANLEVFHLEKLRLEHTAELAERDNALEGSAADLDSFRKQLANTHSRLKRAEAKLLETESRIAQLNLEHDQLKLSVAAWVHAVDARDERLKELGEQLQTLAHDRNDAVANYNVLAEKYNGVVNDLNARSKELNTLVERFNNLAKAGTKASR